jgi:serpin B
MRMVTASRCWGRDDRTYLPSFLDTLSQKYYASVGHLNIGGYPEEARKAINRWIEDNAAFRIRELLPSGSIDYETHLVLTNTAYIIGTWRHRFDRDLTTEESFTLLDGSEVLVSLMRGEENMPYHKGDGYLAMQMPYVGENVSMLFILPEEGGYERFEIRFGSLVLDSIVHNLLMTHVRFSIPRLEFRSEFDLGSTVQDMGIKDAFTFGVANFTGMDGVDDFVPWIDLVAHVAVVRIAEKGTTQWHQEGGMQLSEGECDRFDVVRPFIYVIRDVPTGSILFIGRVLDPSAM